jgi:hypothetical protein
MIQRTVLAASLLMAWMLASGASMAQNSVTPNAPARQPAPAAVKQAKTAQAKTTTVPAATQAVKPAATTPGTAAEERRTKSCHDREIDA